MFNGDAALTTMRMRDDPYYRYVDGDVGVPTSDFYYPVRAGDASSSKVIGAVGIEFLWEKFFVSTAPANSDLMLLVIENTCGQSHSYKFDPTNNRLILQSWDDAHESKYDHLVKGTDYSGFDSLRSVGGGYSDVEVEQCLYQFKLYPTRAMAERYTTSTPLISAVCIGTTFVVASLAFIAYDVLIRRRQMKVMTSAKRNSDIVSSLFPENVRSRLYEHVLLSRNEIGELPPRSPTNLATKSRHIFGSDPIADFFPHATVLFIDIANFTAWSSEREPHQVLSLLETLYFAFDDIARNLGVFKVETIGDCYVAVTGLPQPRKDHAVGTFTI
jgi:Adenylate and Guanylate cyclase catalytic domain